jgi:hypothetical protein
MECVASQELVVVLAHWDSEVVLRLGEQTVGIDEPEAARRGGIFQCVP